MISSSLWSTSKNRPSGCKISFPNFHCSYSCSFKFSITSRNDLKAGCVIFGHASNTSYKCWCDAKYFPDCSWAIIILVRYPGDLCSCYSMLQHHCYTLNSSDSNFCIKVLSFWNKSMTELYFFDPYPILTPSWLSTSYGVTLLYPDIL